MAAHVACFWPVWGWYIERLDDGSDEPWAVMALLAAAALSWPRSGFRLRERDGLLVDAAALTACYAVLVPFMPPLLRALVAMSALACTWVSLSGARAKAPAVICLVALSVPVIATLQFYAGYPLRAVTAAGATCLLNLFGADVVRAGTTMVAGDHTVLVDAPCSGVRMLWTGSALCCVLACMRAQVSWAAMTLALACVVPMVLLANMLRAALLFLLETASHPPPEFLHSLVGMLAFVIVGVSLLAFEAAQARWRRRRQPHAFEPALRSP